MGITNEDLKILRYVQDQQQITLHELSHRFHKNSTSIRRKVDMMNLYANEPLIEIKRSICTCKLSYEELAIFIRNLSMFDYDSTQMERMNVFIIKAFFHPYVNTSDLYASWNLSLTTKKHDMQALKAYLATYHLAIQTVHKKGLTIVGEPLYFHLLVARIMYILFDLQQDTTITERISNNPMEHLCYTYLEKLEGYREEAFAKIDQFLTNYDMHMTTFSTKFFFIFICLTKLQPFKLGENYRQNLPLVPRHIYFTDDTEENNVYNLVMNLLDFSKLLDFPYDEKLANITTTFVANVRNSLTSQIYEDQDLINDCYRYFYKKIIQSHLRVNLLDRLVRNTKDHFPVLYEIVQKYSRDIEATYELDFEDEEYTSLTLLIQKNIIRNRIINTKMQSKAKDIVIVSNSTYARIDYFMAQLKEVLNVNLVSIIQLSEKEKLHHMKYDYVISLSERIYSILKQDDFPVLLLNFFLSDNDIERLVLYGFSRIETKFLTASFVEDIYGLSKEDMIAYLRNTYNDYFI
ncbi:hypothetical protein A4S06_08720 [Erysipelotrichaceae bacterium MTC7]|nr:hypothetical protein A4S06_08720 [Erysipelotrichaceae bacterium MTC7]